MIRRLAGLSIIVIASVRADTISIPLNIILRNGTVTHTGPFTETFSGPFSVPQFNPSLGTLTSIEFSLTGLEQIVYELVSGRLDGQLYPFILPVSEQTSLDSILSTSTAQTFDLGFRRAQLCHGCRDPAPDPGATGNATIADLTLLDPYIGSGSVMLPFSAVYNAFPSIDGQGNVFFPSLYPSPVSIYRAGLTVTYDYTPANSPEPPSAGLIAMAGLIFFANRKLSSRSSPARERGGR